MFSFDVLTGIRMESESLMERKALENEITKGMEQVKQLRASSSGNEESALERMLTSYEEALLILQEIASDEQGQSVMSSSSDAPGASKDSNIISIPSRVNTYGRREPLPVWTKHIKVTSNDTYERSLDDGYKMMDTAGESMVRKTSYALNIQEAITDVHTGMVRVVWLQNNCRGQMRIPLPLRSHTEGSIHALAKLM
ncbi:hypothetical protein CDL12_02867 [Handroanthus impetiginosus]|uniref:Uncharacterized protein n=1 Tax=Handroanthus impetiginosus TaxID=429701 RepID=A0A2G9I3T3_9LAMI|nr:hypothetical protein CDL12_02867 [Handroanthus impetiginosus]